MIQAGHRSRQKRSQVSVRPAWTPCPLPQTDEKYFGPHASIIYACSDTLRNYCEGLWYSGLECKRPTDEEILAKCGILFYKKPIPPHILYAFFNQLDNMFTMSKVMYAIRSITDWLDAIESRAFQVLSVYEINTQIPNFVETLADHWKALKICEQLLPHLGSIYFRVNPLGQNEVLPAKSIIDFMTNSGNIGLRANQTYYVQNNRNPHLWQLSGNESGPVPSLFLEASTELCEQDMLKRLQNRFEEFLIVCHGRTRRQLNARLATQLKINNKCATLPTPDISDSLSNQLTTLDGHYFAKSPCPTKRWRSFSNAKVLYRQPAFAYNTLPDDFGSPATVRRMLARLRRWLYHLPPPTLMLSNNGSAVTMTAARRNLWLTDKLFDGDELVEDVYTWWSFASLSVADGEELDRIVNEAYFLKSLNDVLQMTVDIGTERTTLLKSSKLSSLRRDHTETQTSYSRNLIEELSSHLGESFYHPRSGRTSYRWIRRSLDGSHSPSPPSVTGTELFKEILCPVESIHP